ncbi:two-component sensor histidine kinase [Crocosphaera subtropica ATCC 51142]|uniref:Two-component sensor histidine kinase n=1 Tax=Crocosphaera subtropica (strain ATCC 51142 / BH68) TaxID=43989 RepID=B1WXE1_CROS5|nr:HAMP domain-containing sensor histidine kinase [Crocosphaera subtropica]ACB50885.1 two-component sensor histidine kinase [Crocosphaera subtropica ATCC 51142]
MLHSNQNNNVEKSLLKEILNPSNYDTNLQNITQIIADFFLVDFCLIISDFNHLRYFYNLRNSHANNFKISPSKLSNLIQIPWIIELRSESRLKSIRDLNHKKYQKLLPFFEEIGIKTLLGKNTNFKGQTNGIIILGKQDPHQWSQKEKTKLNEVAKIVGILCHLSQVNMILDEKNLSKDSSFSLSNIPKLLEENPILKLWWQSTRKQLEKQLEWNRKVIYNMITIMSDQTRNPLAIIKMGITILQTRELSSEDFNKRITMLEEAWSNLNEINEKILQLKHLKSQNLYSNLVDTNLKELIEKITKSYSKQWQEDSKKSIKLTTNFNINQEELINTDIQHLTYIIEELLTNASKFSVPNSTVTLSVTQENDTNNSEIIITFSNISEYGCQDNINEFFEPFYREQIVIDTAIPGIGVGLNIVKDLVGLLQGKISVDCLPTENPKHCKIVFRLVLPQSLSSS